MNELEKALEARRQVLDGCRSIVVKAGTRLLTDVWLIPKLIAGIAQLRSKGYQVLLVSSGAVGIGMQQLHMTRRPRALSEVQALAAIGQEKLMSRYDAACQEYGFKSAQLLLTAADLRSRERHLNVLNCINALWKYDILPIVNENDSVSVDELKFGDNDILSGMLAIMTGAQLTIILTTESGLRKRNADGSLGERISVVRAISEEMRADAAGTDNATLSIGGMISKLRAAAMVTATGQSLWVADGRAENVLSDIAAGKDIGTLFLPNHGRLQARKRFIRFFAKSSGRLTVDAGAATAIVEGGKSLLPSGVIASEGKFRRGDTLDICNAEGVLLGRGLSNFSSEECEQIMGRHGSEISHLLGRDADVEMIHRDNFCLA